MKVLIKIKVTVMYLSSLNCCSLQSFSSYNVNQLLQSVEQYSDIFQITDEYIP